MLMLQLKRLPILVQGHHLQSSQMIIFVWSTHFWLKKNFEMIQVTRQLHVLFDSTYFQVFGDDKYELVHCMGYDCNVLFPTSLQCEREEYLLNLGS